MPTTVDLNKVVIYGPNGSPISSTNKLEVNATATIDTSALATQTTLAAILAKLTSDPATQTTLAAILAKILAAPATEAKQDTQITSLGTLITQTDTVEAGIGAIADAAITNPASSASMIALLKGLITLLLATGTSATSIQGAIADGNAIAGKPVLIGASDGTNVQHLLAETTGQLRTGLYNSAGTAFSMASPSDILTNSANGLSVMAYSVLYDATAANWERQRVTNSFIVLNAINTNAEIAAWTPTSGKKFNLMGMWIVGSVAGNYVFRDNTGGTTIALAPSGAGGSGVYCSLGNGKLSAAANNVLTAQGPLTSTLSGMLFGTEE